MRGPIWRRGCLVANSLTPAPLRAAIYESADRMKRALEPVFDFGAYNLPEPELALILEVSFKIGMLREVLVNGDVTADQVDALWQAEKARRASFLEERHG